MKTTFSNLDTFYTPMGHELDCENICKICVDENTFNGVYKAYEKTVGGKSKVKVDDLDKKLVAKAKELSKARKGSLRKTETGEDDEKDDDNLMNNNDDDMKAGKAECTEGQNPDTDNCKAKSSLIDEEVEKEKDQLESEVDFAVKKVVDTEGTSSEDKIQEIANRVRAKMEKKYRKAAARKHGISFSAYEKEKSKLAARKLKVNSKTKGDDLTKLKKQYFEVCVKSEAKFYAYAPIKDE